MKKDDPLYVPDYKNEALPVSKIDAPRTLKPDGWIIIGGEERAQTLQCRHCGAHWVVLKGSGRKRGWCLKCDGPLCGAELCMKYHVPHELGLQAEEKGLNIKETLDLVDSQGKIIV